MGDPFVFHWHGHKNCARSKRPSTNKEFWKKKLTKNMERDKRHLRELEQLGWKAL